MKRSIATMNLLLIVAGVMVLVGCATSLKENGEIKTSSTRATSISKTLGIGSDGFAESQGLWVTGRGSVSVTADLAIFSLGVQARANSLLEARQRAAEAMSSVLQTLYSQGIEKQDVQTGNLRIQPTYNRDGITGYEVSHQITVKARDFDKLGAIIDQSAAAAGDQFRFHYIGFTKEDPTVQQQVARELAVNDALNKAAELSKLSGVTLGPLIYITESGDQVSAPVARFEASALGSPPGMTTPISVGELDVEVNVVAGFGIHR